MGAMTSRKVCRSACGVLVSFGRVVGSRYFERLAPCRLVSSKDSEGAGAFEGSSAIKQVLERYAQQNIANSARAFARNGWANMGGSSEGGREERPGRRRVNAMTVANVE